MTLKPRRERPPADEIVQELRPAVMRIPGIKAYVQNVPAIRIGQLTKSAYQYTLQDTDTAELYQWAPRVEEKLKALPSLVDVTSDLQITQPQVSVEIDRNKASSLGVSAQSIEHALRCVRLAAGFDDLCPDQPVLGGDGARAALPDRSVDAGIALRAVEPGALVPLNAVATLKPRSVRWR